jgi:hypothetical protein
VPIARNHNSRFVSLSIIANARAAWIVPGLSDDLVSLSGLAPWRPRRRRLRVAQRVEHSDMGVHHCAREKFHRCFD